MPTELIGEMFGIHAELMKFSWYVFFYMVLMIFLPIFHKYLVEKYSDKKVFYIMLGVLALSKGLAVIIKAHYSTECFIYSAVDRQFFRFLPMVICGYMCAKYNVLEHLSTYFAAWISWKKHLGIIGLLVGYTYFHTLGGINPAFLYVPPFIGIIMALKLDYTKFLNKIVLLLGRHSMNIWFLHCIFFSEITKDVFQKYAIVGNPVFDVLWILFICTCVSIPLTVLQKLITKNL